MIHTWTNVNLASGATTTPALNYSWDTTGATTGTHTLTVTAATVTNEFITANNSATTTNQVDPAGDTHDVAVISVTADPDPVSAPGGGTFVTLTVIVENQGTVSESIDLTLETSTVVNPICNFTGVTLGAGATSTTEFQCQFKFKFNTHGGLNTLTATATIAVDDDLSDNVGTGTLQVNN